MTVRHVAMLAVTLFIAILAARTGAAGEPVSVFVSVLPQKYFVQQIGKDLVTVDAMVKPGASPATYEPRPGQMAALSRARAYFAVGVLSERAWLEKIAAANPGMRMVHTDHGIEKLPMAAHRRHDGQNHRDGDAHGDAHGDGGGGILDPHIWLSPPLVITQVRTILSVLGEIDPAHRSFYQTNGKAFISRILDLDAELRETFSGKNGLRFMVFHPAWGYFAHAYGLRQVPVEIEGKAPKPARLAALVADARARGIRMVFVQPQFSARSARLIAREINGEVVAADPLALDWGANLRIVAEKFRQALR